MLGAFEIRFSTVIHLDGWRVVGSGKDQEIEPVGNRRKFANPLEDSPLLFKEFAALKTSKEIAAFASRCGSFMPNSLDVTDDLGRGGLPGVRRPIEYIEFTGPMPVQSWREAIDDMREFIRLTERASKGLEIDAWSLYGAGQAVVGNVQIGLESTPEGPRLLANVDSLLSALRLQAAHRAVFPVGDVKNCANAGCTNSFLVGPGTGVKASRAYCSNKCANQAHNRAAAQKRQAQTGA